MEKFIFMWLIWLAFISVLSCQELQKNFFTNITQNAKKIAETTTKLQDDLKAPREAVMDEYVEILLEELNDFLKINSMNGASMPDLEKKFKKRILLITYHGIIYLKNGWLNGLNTTKLYRNAIVTYNRPNVKLHMPLEYKTLTFDYNYKANFMNLGPKGKIRGTVKNFKFTIDVHINMITLKVQQQKFIVNSFGKYSIKFTGDILTDWLKNILIPVVKPLIEPIIKEIIEYKINKGLKTIADHFNAGVCWILQNC